MLSYTPIYASLLALLYLRLSAGIIRIRRRERIALLDGGREDLNRAIRAHGNFAEYVPMLVLLLGCFEVRGGSVLLVHLLGVSIVAGRVLHAYGLLSEEPAKGSFQCRTRGMMLTFTSLGVLAGANLLLSLMGMVGGQ